MAFSVSVGESDFEDIRMAASYYVDKTDIMYKLVEETGNKVTLFTRPRRFGKTLMMSMMSNFFSIKKDGREIFKGLKITEHKEFCEKWMNNFPVLFISFKDVDGLNFEGAYKMLKSRLYELCVSLTDLTKDNFVDDYDKQLFLRLKSKTADDDEVKNSLKTIMRMMHAVYGKKVILLIDEYDVPLAKASEKDDGKNNFYSSMLDVIRGIMSTALKDNEFLEFAVITGCLRIAKESIFTGTNNFASYSVLDEDFSEYFGFSEDEVEKMLSAAEADGIFSGSEFESSANFQIPLDAGRYASHATKNDTQAEHIESRAELSLSRRKDKSALIKEWYDGYVFGNSHVYCPWDVVNYMSALKMRMDAKPKNYWKNTSHNGILLTFVERTDFNVSDKFEVLMNGGTVMQTISDELTYDTLHETEDNLWSVLLMTGYVTKADPYEDGDKVALKIPNREIATIFEDTVAVYFKDTVDIKAIDSLIFALWEGSVEDASRLISDLLWETISYNDYHEDYYHAFLAGIFVGRGYHVESNKEKGLGRPDILLKDKKNRRAIIIEAKKSLKEAELNKDCDEAVKQIVTGKYAEGLYGYEKVLCYGVAFFKKQAKVKRL